jgi:hypothetical protein
MSAGAPFTGTNGDGLIREAGRRLISAGHLARHSGATVAVAPVVAQMAGELLDAISDVVEGLSAEEAARLSPVMRRAILTARAFLGTEAE